MTQIAAPSVMSLCHMSDNVWGVLEEIGWVTFSGIHVSIQTLIS